MALCSLLSTSLPIKTSRPPPARKSGSSASGDRYPTVLNDATEAQDIAIRADFTGTAPGDLLGKTISTANGEIYLTLAPEDVAVLDFAPQKAP